MPRSFFVLSVLLAFSALTTKVANAQKAETPSAIASAPAYRCLPCGQSCDEKIYTTEGTCEHCNMKLIPANTINFKEVSPENVCRFISANPQTVIVDVRTPEEYTGTASPDFGRLKNAINIPIATLRDGSADLSNLKGKNILVYCSHSHRSPQAAYLLNLACFNNVTNMSGGISKLTNSFCKN